MAARAASPPAAEQPSDAGRRWTAWLVDAVILGVAAGESPVHIWARNPVGIGHPERLALIAVTAWFLALAGVVAARLLGARRTTAVVTAFVTILVVMRGGPMINALGYPLGTVSMVGGVGILAFLVSRRARQQVVTWLLVAVCVVLMADPVQAYRSTRSSLGSDLATMNTDLPAVDLVAKPDIYVVVADAYAGLIAFEDVFRISEPQWRITLEERGFQVPESAWSPYPLTQAALPSLLDMAYPLEAGPGVEPATTRTLYEMIAGRNQLVHQLSRNGYEITMVESGWSGSTCGDLITHCVSSPFLDEATFLAVSRTVFGRAVLGKWGHPFTVGARGAMDWLMASAPELSANGVPDLVLVHLEIPHPPFFLDADCEYRHDDSLGGTTLAHGELDLEKRKAAYLEQAACVDMFLAAVSDLLDDGSILVFAADHGTDSHDQLALHPAEWDEERIVERLNVMFAVRADDCEMGDPVVLTNVFRRILSCLSSSDIEPVEPRFFVYTARIMDGVMTPIVEVSLEVETSAP